jgi:hypothetical protein
LGSSPRSNPGKYGHPKKRQHFSMRWSRRLE